jgi:hypothetical protein
MKEKKVLVPAIVDRMKQVVCVSKDVDLAEALGLSRSNPAVWKIRDRIPFAECMAIAEKHGVSLDWLVLGRGTPEIDALAGSVPAPDSCGEREAAYVELQAFEMPDLLNADSSQLLARVPAVWIEREGLAASEPVDPMAMRYVGNNMAPTIVDGDVLIVDRRPRDVDGVYVMRLGDSIRIKRVQRMQGGALHLLNDNPKYEMEVLDAMQADAVEFIGYCFGILRGLS